jgi:hypothetical protein
MNIDHRQQMKLILAFQHAEEFGNDAYEISFAPMRDDSPVSLEGQSIVVNDRTGECAWFIWEYLLTVFKVARRLQMALTGHNVSER